MNFCSLLAKRSLVIRGSQCSNFNGIALLSTAPPIKPPPSKNPKHKTSIQITLISGDNKIEITSLDNAKKMAERRQLKLVSIVDYDVKTSRPVYRLMTGSEYHQEEIKRRDEKKESRKEQHIKSEKLLTLTHKIAEHDLQAKIAKCVKWIEKLHEIRVVISGDESSMQQMEKMISAMEEQVKPVGGRILQKRVKDGVIKFSIMPTIKKEVKEQAPGEKKLLSTDNLTPEFQQVRSHHTKVFLQLAHPYQHQLNLQTTTGSGRISTKCSKCGDDKQTVTSKRIKISAIVGILLLAKYGLWSFIYCSLKK